MTALLRSELPGVRFDEPLAGFTTIGIGGRAAYLVEAVSLETLERSLKFCSSNGLPYRVLGGGSNVIISDAGFPGLVIINRADGWRVLDEKPQELPQRQIAERFSIAGDANTAPASPQFSGKLAEAVRVRIESGARIIPLIKKLHAAGISGLHWFSGIPASIGGALFMNLHGGNEFFGDYVLAAQIFNGHKSRWEKADYFSFDYDWTALHETGEVVLCVDLCLFRGQVEEAKKLSVIWARQKSLQPQRSAGCVFQNLTRAQQDKLALPTSSVGYVLDKLLNLKGLRVGGAMLSTKHAAFIENAGNASAQDVFTLARTIQKKTRQALDLELKLEIEFIGNFKEELCQNL